MSLEVEVGNKKATIFLKKDEIDSKNCCVGFTSKLVNKIVPNYVGNDIGCGIVSYPIELDKSLDSFRKKQLEKIVKDIDVNLTCSSNWRSLCFMEEMEDKSYCFDNFSQSVNRIFDLSNIEIEKFKIYYKEKFGKDISDKIPTYNREWLEELLKRTKISDTEFYGSLMTLGNGNHFIEFNRSENDKKEYVTVHSGSRIVGKKICDFHQKKIYSSNTEEIWEEFDRKVQLFNKKNKNKKERLEYRNSLREEIKSLEKENNKKYLEEDEAIDYYIDMIFGQKYAIVNRELMIKFVLNKLSDTLTFDPSKKIESIHNYIDFEDFVMRKGAIRSKKDELCLIALNMAEGILLCKGKGNEDWNNSCAHGTGRQITREKAIKSKIPMEKRLRKILEEKEVFSSAILRLIVDESPECYKDSSLIIERIQPTIEIIDHLKPFINIKTDTITKGDT